MIILNKEQQEAANFLGPIAAVIAVPGSGKTMTMMERIGILVKDHGIAPENILGLTFTRNAAEEMRYRLTFVLGDLASRVTLSTIHSFCHYLLRSEGHVFDILSGKDQVIFIRNIMKELRIKDLSLGMVLREISLAMNNLISVDEFRDLYEGDKTMLKVGDVYHTYQEKKSKKMLMDFDDLLVTTCQILKDNEDVREKYRSIFKHLLVDEFQDTNPAQMEILKLMRLMALESPEAFRAPEYYLNSGGGNQSGGASSSIDNFAALTVRNYMKMTKDMATSDTPVPLRVDTSAVKK